MRLFTDNLRIREVNPVLNAIRKSMNFGKVPTMTWQWLMLRKKLCWVILMMQIFFIKGKSTGSIKKTGDSLSGRADLMEI